MNLRGFRTLRCLDGYTPGIIGSVVVVALFLSFQTVSNASMVSLCMALGVKFDYAYRGLSALAALCVHLLLWWAITGRSPYAVFYPRNALGSYRLCSILAPLIGFAIALSLVRILLFYGYLDVLTSEDRDATITTMMRRHGLAESSLPQLVGLALISPLAEEMLLRGIVLHGLLKRYSAPVAIVISALIFAASHLDADRLGLLSVSGCVYGWLYYTTRSVLTGWIAHGAHNAISSYLVLIAHLPPLVVYSLAMLAVPAGALLLEILRRRLQRPN